MCNITFCLPPFLVIYQGQKVEKKTRVVPVRFSFCTFLGWFVFLYIFIIMIIGHAIQVLYAVLELVA